MLILKTLCAILGAAAAFYWALGMVVNVCVFLRRISGHGSFSGIYMLPFFAGLLAGICGQAFGLDLATFYTLAMLPDAILLLGEGLFWFRWRVLRFPDKDAPRENG